MNRDLDRQVGTELIKEGLQKLSSFAGDAFRLLVQLDEVRALKERYVLAKSMIELGLSKVDGDSAGSPPSAVRRSYTRRDEDKILPGRLSGEKQLLLLNKLVEVGQTGLLQKELAEMSVAHESAISRFLAAAEKNGLVNRTQTDRNALRCFITDLGVEVIGKRAITIRPISGSGQSPSPKLP